jgi:D-alanyl-D-alanine carboxypeptidase
VEASGDELPVDRGIVPIMPGRSRLVALAAVLCVLGAAIAYGTGWLGRPAVTDPQVAAAASSPSPTVGPTAHGSAAPIEPSPTATQPPPLPGSSAPTPSPSTGLPGASGSPPPLGLPPSATPETVRRLDAALERLRVRQAIPGISVAMIFPDGTSWTGTSGQAIVATRTPVTSDTVFAAASISKTFTAAAALALVEEGRLGLDESVAARLPELRLDPRITVRMLLGHTSGLHDFFFHRRIDRALLADRDAAWTTGRTLRYVGKRYFRPGRGWHYSNTNYLVLGLLVERETGRSLAAEVRRRFFEPLGLSSAYTQAVETPRGPIAHGYRFAVPARTARPIDLSDGTLVMPFRSVVTAAAGAGSIAATPADLAAWAHALYGGEVLDPETLAWMVDPVPTSRYKPRVPYGLGAQAVTIDGRAAVGHSGRFVGFRSVMRWLPEERIAIVVMTNQSRRDPGVVARSLLRVVLGPPPAPAPSPCPADCPATR